MEQTVLCEVIDVLKNGDTLILTWGDDGTWIDVGPGCEALTNEYVIHTLRPALLAVEGGYFDLWRSAQTIPVDNLGLHDLFESTSTSFFDGGD